MPAGSASERQDDVDPSPPAIGRRLMRGLPVGGASTSSSRVTPWTRASGSNCSSVGRRRPASSLDSVLVEMPVSSARSASVMSRRRRRLLESRSDGVEGAVQWSSMPRSLPFGNICLRHRAALAAHAWRDDARIRQGLLGAALAAGAPAARILADRPAEPVSRPRDQRPGAGHGAGCRVRRAAPKRSGWRPRGWQVTAADISAEALARAAERAAASERRRAACGGSRPT